MQLPNLGKALKARGKRPPGQGTAFKATRGSKFVLFIGDEGTILVYIKGSTVISRNFVPDASENHLTEFRNVLATDPKSPIVVVVDSIDQSYIQQTLPPVSSLSVGRLIKRRLDRDFGSNDVKGAIILGREATGRKDWNFMMVALENSPQLSKWFEFVGSLSNRFVGIHLVSVEAELFVKYLRHAMGPSLEGDSEWTFLVSHNKVGGFRQVILRKGRIIFTRMAQPIGESTPEVIAGNIEQEMLSTIEYIRRLAYNPQNGLDVYIIASSAIKAVIDKSKFQARQVNILSPYEVAQYLAIQGATQPTDQFGDVVLASVIGASPKHVLTLSTPSAKSFDSLYTIQKYQRVGAAVAAAGMLAYAGSIVYGIYDAYSSGADLEHKKTTQQHSLQQLQDDIKATNLNVDQANDLIDIYKQLNDERVSPVPFVARLETALTPAEAVTAIDWSLQEVKGGKPDMTVVLTMSFPGVTTLDGFKAVSHKLMDALKAAFTGYNIAFTKLPTVYSESEKVDITFGTTATVAQSTEPLDVQLTIKGPADLPSPAAGDSPAASAPAGQSGAAK